MTEPTEAGRQLITMTPAPIRYGIILAGPMIGLAVLLFDLTVSVLL